MRGSKEVLQKAGSQLSPLLSEFLVCPLSKQPLRYCEESNSLISDAIGVSFPVDMYAESRVEKPLPMYVPRDERFEESKQNTFSVKRLKVVLHNLIPSLKASISANNQDFNDFTDVDGLYSEGLLIKLGLQDDVLKKLPLPKFVSKIQESNQGLLDEDMKDKQLEALEGLGGPMTRARTKRAKEAMQQVLAAIFQTEPNVGEMKIKIVNCLMIEEKDA